MFLNRASIWSADREEFLHFASHLARSPSDRKVLGFDGQESTGSASSNQDIDVSTRLARRPFNPFACNLFHAPADDDFRLLVKEVSHPVIESLIILLTDRRDDPLHYRGAGLQTSLATET